MSGPAYDRRITPARPDLAAAHLRGTVEAARFVEGEAHRVIAPVVPLRREPRAACGLDTELLRGEAFTVYDRDAAGWAWGQAATDGYVGWLPAGALQPDTGAPPNRKVTVLRTFVYPQASIKTPPVEALPFGSTVLAGAPEGNFLPVENGFVWANHCAPLDRVAADPVAVAETLLGVPYLWGGRSTLGLDCSALVQTGLAACGQAAPRDSDMQERTLGQAVDLAGERRRGDLVFWRGHVGWLREAGTLLHANGHTMTVASEPLAEAIARIAAGGGGPVTSLRRLP